MPRKYFSIAAISPTTFEQADAAIANLSRHQTAWLQTDISKRLNYLRRCVKGVISVAEPWVTAACIAKGIDPNSTLAGEEWLVGPVPLLLNLNLLIKALTANGQPQPVEVVARSQYQLVAKVFPDTLIDRLLWLGFRGEVWIEPNKPATQGLIYRNKPTQAAIALVLGAGNISSIAPMDALYKLFAQDQVVLLKMNPVNEYMGAFLEQALQPLIADGLLQIVYGGAELGSYLCQHPDIAAIHITGSQQTHDAIVWGNIPVKQCQAAQPQLTKPITSELGCVTPILVVPGHWSKADIAFQARHVASMVVHNASFNCVAGKVLVMAKNWSQRQDFLAQVQQELAKIPARRAYYPGAQARYEAFLDRYPQAQVIGLSAQNYKNEPPIIPWTIIPDVPAALDEYALNTEAFCGILAEVSLDAADAESFLTQAVDFANQYIWGNLSCVLLVDSFTQKRCAKTLETAIADLHYGAIGINVWTGIIYAQSALSWGAFPGNSLDDIRSGRGVVHNAYLFEHPQKSVLRAPFRIRPLPIWFANHRNLRQLAQRFASLQASPSWGKFLKIVFAALKG